MDSETLDNIRKHARLQLTPEQVEVQCGLEDDAIANNEDATRAYREGKTQGIVNIRGVLMQQVRDGNVQAAREMSRYADETEPDYVDE